MCCLGRVCLYFYANRLSYFLSQATSLTMVVLEARGASRAEVGGVVRCRSRGWGYSQLPGPGSAHARVPNHHQDQMPGREARPWTDRRGKVHRDLGSERFKHGHGSSSVGQGGHICGPGSTRGSWSLVRQQPRPQARIVREVSPAQTEVLQGPCRPVGPI